MGKIIIHTNDLKDDEALSYVSHVISGGKISKTRRGEQYCFASVYKSGVRVEASLSKSGTHTFRLWKISQ